jgi:hypothetical protein
MHFPAPLHVERGSRVFELTNIERGEVENVFKERTKKAGKTPLFQARNVEL